MIIAWAHMTSASDYMICVTSTISNLLHVVISFAIIGIV